MSKGVKSSEKDPTKSKIKLKFRIFVIVSSYPCKMEKNGCLEYCLFLDSRMEVRTNADSGCLDRILEKIRISDVAAAG